MTSKRAAERLTEWAKCVQRLIAVAPTRAVIEETGITASGHTTPPERKAIREQAQAVVTSWLERDLAIVDRLAATRGEPPEPGLREALRDANAIIAMTREHLAKDHPDCAYTALGVMNDASRAALVPDVTEPVP